MEDTLADYLIVKPGDPSEVLYEVTGKNITQAIDSLELEDGDSVSVYRIAAPPRKVTVKTETVRKVSID